MPFLVEVESEFRAQQGLVSTVRRAEGLPSLDEADGRRCYVLRVGLSFTQEQVDNDLGRGVNSDVVSLVLHEETERLAAQPWTSLFSFRPSLERVARELFDVLQSRLEALEYVELADSAAGLTVRYRPARDAPRVSGSR